MQTLAIELLKVKNNLAPEIVNDVFKLKDRSYNTKKSSMFQCRNIKTLLYESETLPSLGPQICNPIPPEKSSIN